MFWNDHAMEICDLGNKSTLKMEALTLSTESPVTPMWVETKEKLMM